MKLLRKIHFSLFTLLIVNFMAAQGKPSSSKEVATGKINGATITINYGSPSVNGREIWGALVPFNQVWRAGANDATTFETDKELTVEGSKLPAGKYSFFIIPNDKECVIIFNKEAKQWGAYKYKEKEDQLRVTVKQKVAKAKTEKLVYVIEKNTVSLNWDNWTIPFSVK
ncbi:DUF2911 domain-containing protein [Flavobacterium sinopsychrotolerans]|uniref:DUF2911 domain-containing protein n=1 Tax=Flavobacterium sinopsychrotolerans TaxID=604089 RepID=A0A1H8M8Z3_9FLAO|nr:DUF2911 domain-containing protein [Flavobacterium sinopsychrotolerans]SEO13730.1 Protein of unknown function [Flavobacterium sinopsychrotolerans]